MLLAELDFYQNYAKIMLIFKNFAYFSEIMLSIKA